MNGINNMNQGMNSSPGMINPGMMNPGMMNPGMMNPGMMNPGMMNPGMMNPGMNPGPIDPTAGMSVYKPRGQGTLISDLIKKDDESVASTGSRSRSRTESRNESGRGCDVPGA